MEFICRKSCCVTLHVVAFPHTESLAQLYDAFAFFEARNTSPNQHHPRPPGVAKWIES